MSAPLSSAPVQRQPLTFEFTKKKRWAELLVAELPDAISLVLCSGSKILYCGSTVKEILGWCDDELIDRDLSDFMNPDDQAKFRASFAKSVRTNTDLHSFVHLTRKNQLITSADYHSPPSDILVEIKGRPHTVFVDNDEEAFTCVFAVAKPFPGANGTKLDTFLHLKMENERSQQRLMWLRANDSASSAGLPLHYAASSMHPPPRVSQAPPSDIYSRSVNNAGWGIHGEPLSSPTRSTFDDGYASDIYPPGASISQSMEDEASEDGSKKKKLRKSCSEQHVCITCGRTESPEWRKGPEGPKTLCNACGLRWAKQMKKFDDSNEAVGDVEAAPSF